MAGYLDDAPARSGLLGYSVKLAAAVIVGGLAVVLIIDGSGLSSKTPAGAAAVAATRRPAAAPVSELVVPAGAPGHFMVDAAVRSEEHTSELQSLMRISYAVFCSKKNTHTPQ